MNVAFVDIALDPARPGASGLSDLVWDMAPRLAALGDTVRVVGPYAAAPDRCVSVRPFAIPPLGYRNIAGVLWLALRAHRALLALDGLDVIHTPEYVTGAVIGALNRRTPVVFTEPGNIYERVARGNPYDFITTQVYKAAARVASARAAGLIATSAWMGDWWRRTGLPPARVSLIPLGIDTTLFRPIPAARAALGWPADRPVVLFAARLSVENGLDVALRARARLKDTAFDLHVLGAGPEEPRYRELAAELSPGRRVYWHGWVDYRQLPACYSAADVFVFSGHSGGTPRVLLQAMGCGCPVVASAIGGITDHVRDGRVDDGSNGLLFPAGDDAALADALARLLADAPLRRALGRSAAAYARAAVDWDVLIPRVRDVYRRAIAHPRRSRRE